MLQYLATVQARNMNIVECLNFLFQLSFATIGKVIFRGRAGGAMGVSIFR
jgi:hypothetical protein